LPFLLLIYIFYLFVRTRFFSIFFIKIFYFNFFLFYSEFKLKKFFTRYPRGTRYLFRRPFRKHATIPLCTYLTTYKTGQLLHIKGNASVEKGMPYKYYHGKTAKVINVLKRSVQVFVNKPVKQRLFEKKVILRVEHVKPARYAEGLKKKREKVQQLKKLSQKHNICGLNLASFFLSKNNNLSLSISSF
jgi:large subunit ribosomal protein L21e